MKTGKPKKAVALKYDPQKDRAPKVVAKGKGDTARRIIEIAREHNIPLHEDGNLSQLLEFLDIESEIPPELYRAVAEVLVFVVRLNQRYSPS